MNTRPVIVFLTVFLIIAAGLGLSWGKSDELFNFSSRQENALIVHVNSSDILTLEDGRKVHLIGIESAGKPPRRFVELDKQGRPVEVEPEPTISLEEQAFLFSEQLLDGKKVRLEFDVDALDAQGHREVYVFLPDGKLANAEILRQGFAHLRLKPPNMKYALQLRDAYQEAKREQRGFAGN